MGDNPTFKKRHGLKKVVLTAGEISLERSVGPIRFGRRAYGLDSISHVRFHSTMREASDQHGRFDVLVSGFTLILKDEPADGLWSRTISREPWRGLAAPLKSYGVRLGSAKFFFDRTERPASTRPDRPPPRNSTRPPPRT
jgi:hypothetical protein